MASIQATFYTFEKRDNSTKKPTDSGTTLSVTFKEETDILNPRLEVRYSGAFGFNYVFLDFTNRYYKITQATSIAHDTYYLECSHDVLANWIDDAKGQSVCAEYCSYDYNENIDDSRVTPVNLVDTQVLNGGRPEILTQVPYMFLSAITSSGELSGTDIFFDSSAGGSFGNFIESLSDITFWEQIQTGAVSNQCNAFDFLNDLYFCPFIPNFCHDTTTKSTQILGKQLSGQCIQRANVKRHSFTFNSIPRPSNTDFRYTSKYVKYYLNLPYVGVVDIPTELIKGAVGGSPAEGLTIEYSGDCITGLLTMSVKVRGISMGVFGTTLKASIGIARQYKPDPTLRIIQAAGAAGLAGAKLGGAIGAATGAIGAGIGMGLHEYFRAPEVNRVSSCNGGLGLFALTDSDKFQLCMAESRSSIDPATLTAIAGRPADKVTTIQNGYIKTSGASVSLGALAEEVTAFNNLLNGGVYVE